MIKSISSNLMRFDFYQTVFAVVAWLIVPSAFYFLPNVFEFIRLMKSHNIETAHVSDAKLVIASALFQMCVSILVKKSFSRFVYENLDDKYQGAERLSRLEKVTKMIYDNIFYTTSTVFAYYYFGHTPIISKWIGGQAECDGLFESYPAKPNIPYFNEFFLYQMGNHLYRLVHHVITCRKDARFYEMFLHHYVTFMLIFYSYTFNYTAMGSSILILHDVGDIFLSGGRAYDSMKNKIKYVWYAGMISVLGSWIYTRILVLPLCLEKACWNHHGTVKIEGVWELTGTTFIWMEALLATLFVLHCYWVMTFISIGIKSLKKGTVRLSANPKRQKKMETSKDD